MPYEKRGLELLILSMLLSKLRRRSLPRFACQLLFTGFSGSCFWSAVGVAAAASALANTLAAGVAGHRCHHGHCDEMGGGLDGRAALREPSTVRHQIKGMRIAY
jgi:hypothetical protein